MEELQKECVTFFVFGKSYDVYVIENEITSNTIIEFDDFYYHIGNEPNNIETLMFAWQDVNKRDLSEQEIQSILKENNL